MIGILIGMALGCAALGIGAVVLHIVDQRAMKRERQQIG